MSIKVFTIAMMITGGARATAATAADYTRTICEHRLDPAQITPGDVDAAVEVLRWVSLVHPAFERAAKESVGSAEPAALLALGSAYTLIPPLGRGFTREWVLRKRYQRPESDVPDDVELDVLATRAHSACAAAMAETIEAFAAAFGGDPAGFDPPPRPAVEAPAPPHRPTLLDVTDLARVGGSYRELLRVAFEALDEVARAQMRVNEARIPDVDWAKIHAERSADVSWTRGLLSEIVRVRTLRFEVLAVIERTEAALARLGAWQKIWAKHFEEAAPDDDARAAFTNTEARGFQSARAFVEQLGGAVDLAIGALGTRGKIEHDALEDLAELELLAVKHTHRQIEAPDATLEFELEAALRTLAQAKP